MRLNPLKRRFIILTSKIVSKYLTLESASSAEYYLELELNVTFTRAFLYPLHTMPRVG